MTEKYIFISEKYFRKNEKKFKSTKLNTLGNTGISAAVSKSARISKFRKMYICNLLHGYHAFYGIHFMDGG